MTRWVLDSSIALAWMLPGEGDYATEQLRDEIAAAGAATPGLSPLETSNMLLVAEKPQRITPAERRQALAPSAGLPVPIDPDTAAAGSGPDAEPGRSPRSHHV